MGIFKRFNQLAWRLTLLYSFIFLSVNVFAVWFSGLGVRNVFLQHHKDEFKHLTSRIAQEIEDEIYQDGSYNISRLDLVQDVDVFLKAYAIRITDKNGRLIGSSSKIIGVKLPTGVKEGQYIKFKSGQTDFLYYKTLIKNNSYSLVLEFVKDIEPLTKIEIAIVVNLLLSIFFGASLALLSGLFLARQILKPLNRITGMADSITIGNLSERLEVNEVDDELSRLAKTFNKMLARLEQAVRAQKEFVSNASHELRTPLLAIKGYINLLARWGAKDEQVLNEAIIAIQEETGEMQELIQKLLLIAKGEEHHAFERSPFFWNDLVSKTIEQVRLFVPESDIQIITNPEITLIGDQAMLQQMLRIFVDNSIKYTPPNGIIRLWTTDLGDAIEFVIENTGVGIPQDELERVFERFYTVDKTRGKEKGGHGLGLYLAKQIIQRHLGNVSIESIESEDRSFTKVWVLLPKGVE